jgi:outer membrane immunogenic protein
LAGIVSPAVAADMAVKAPPPAPTPVATVYDWTGFYIGGNGGWGDSRNCFSFVGGLVGGGGVTGDGCRSRDGGIAGGQIGYRWQSNQFVFGIEAQGDWADLSSSRVSVLNPLFSTGTRTDAIGLFTGQLGWAWNAALLYVKGGAAVTDNRAFISSNLTGAELVSGSATRWGGTLGVGFEYGFSPNWTLGAEYDHLWMGDNSYAFAGANPIVAGAAARVSQDVDMVTIRLNYRFGGLGTTGTGFGTSTQRY